MTDPTDIHEQEQEAEAFRLRELQLQRTKDEDLKWLMGTKPGRRIAWRQLADTGVFRNPFDRDTTVMAFNCGQMNVGQRLLAQVMELAPDEFLRMLKEAKLNDN